MSAWRRRGRSARAGAHVILAVRNIELGAQRAAEIGGDTSVVKLDLADQSSVRAFPDLFDGDVDILDQQRGRCRADRSETVDGFEMTIGTNFLGPFALTNLLFPRVRSQIVNVGSDAHKSAKMRSRRPAPAHHRGQRMGAYGRSKLAVMLWGLELDRRLRAAGSPVVSQLTHPGWVASNLSHVSDKRVMWRCTAVVRRRPACWPTTSTQGAAPTLYCISEPIPPGSYVGIDGRLGLQGGPTLSGRSARRATTRWPRSWSRSPRRKRAQRFPCSARRAARVVGGDDQQVRVAAGVQLGEPGVVVAHPLRRRRSATPTAACRAARADAVDGAAVVERVAGSAGSSGRPRRRRRTRARAVAGQRHQDDAGRDLVEFLGGGEPAPRLAVGLVVDEVRSVRPLRAAEPEPLPTARLNAPRELRGGHVDLGVREVGEAADVVDVEVGRDDVADVVDAKPEALDLPGRGLGGIEPRPQQVAGRARSAVGSRAVAQAETGVHEDEPAIGLDEQDVADEAATGESMVPQLRWCTRMACRGSLPSGNRSPSTLHDTRGGVRRRTPRAAGTQLTPCQRRIRLWILTRGVIESRLQATHNPREPVSESADPRSCFC